MVQESLVKAGLLWYFSSDYSLPDLLSVNDLQISEINDIELIAKVTQQGVEVVKQKVELGNRAYIGFINNEAAAYGWSSFKSATFGPQKNPVEVPENNRYLWDFVTYPQWRGRGIYSQMLRAIIKNELNTANSFWIIHQHTNLASMKGISKAGFVNIGDIFFDENKELTLTSIKPEYEKLVQNGSMILNIKIKQNERT